MATTKIWKVQKRLDHVIDYATNKEKTRNNYSEYGMDEFDSIRQVMTYATNPDKTEKQFYTTGINCEVKDSVKQMQLIKMIYGKENGILAFHAYQSFNEGEVTPEIAHEIGVKLANEMWGDRFQVVVSTHLNTEHLHNHFVINSVSFKDGKKYYSNLTNTALLRKTSDEICEEYGLSVLTEKTCKSGINFENDYIRSEKILPYMLVKNRHFTTRNKVKNKYRPKGIVALYYYYKYLLKLYTKKNIQYKLTPEMRAEVKKMDEYSERIRFLCKYKIETMSDVDNIKEQKQEELQKILNIRNRLYYKRQKLDSEIEKDRVTKEIIDVTANLTRIRKEIRLCDKFYDDVPKMKEQIRKTEEKLNKKEKEKRKDRKHEI